MVRDQGDWFLKVAKSLPLHINRFCSPAEKLKWLFKIPLNMLFFFMLTLTCMLGHNLTNIYGMLSPWLTVLSVMVTLQAKCWNVSKEVTSFKSSAKVIGKQANKENLLCRKPFVQVCWTCLQIFFSTRITWHLVSSHSSFSRVFFFCCCFYFFECSNQVPYWLELNLQFYLHLPFKTGISDCLIYWEVFCFVFHSCFQCFLLVGCFFFNIISSSFLSLSKFFNILLQR